jgi:hypothetical protein
VARGQCGLEAWAVATIEVKQTAEGDPMQLEVTVTDGRGASRHAVTLRRTTYERLTGGTHSAEVCVDAAFRFLLDREPRDAILGQFDMAVISDYFPEFEARLPDYLAGS